ncbi:hypothetical protein Cri9333_2518 [Crinalium epipsammum PCC 9333]|uniref:Uncharacterized protein n=1 Tax=Crinalium epipsammum PCC 9333 TaxID=1173022 RepID=K9W0R4_9CYAN|nr:hypothetical protein [Crinalium epipsammum]AFZ13384.1 hypothetical protein Cri9333_2518 [Crinalium epipsammum PCC 9333]
MSPELPNQIETSKYQPALEVTELIAKFRNSIWMFGIPSWLFGISDRGLAAFADGYLSPVEILHLLTASFFFLSWLSLKPEPCLATDHVDTLTEYIPNLNSAQQEGYAEAVQARTLELQEYHMIRQEYLLPFPYICQIYHLLNLKHLETIHGFSLNNLKVIKVSNIQPTTVGGMVKFQTILDSQFNALRIWRQPIVEVQLILHTPYTVELNIPAYNNNRIVVIFNVIPVNETEHKFLIDIYSNIPCPKFLLQVILHFASCLTLFEDLPYLKKLAQTHKDRLFNSSQHSNQETMWLFKRFVDLYGSPIKSLSSTKDEALNG